MTAAKSSHLLPPIEQHLLSVANRRNHRKHRVSSSANGYNFPLHSNLAIVDASHLDVTNQDFVFIDSPENWPVNLSPIPVKRRSTRDFFFALLFLSFVGFLVSFPHFCAVPLLSLSLSFSFDYTTFH